MLTPSPQLVDAYLGEIAKGYNIAWSPPSAPDDAGGDGSSDNNDDGGVKVSGRSMTRGGTTSTRSPVFVFWAQSEKVATALDSPLPDAATISAEARSTGARTPKLPELPPTEDEGPSRTQPSKEDSKPAPPPEDDFEMLAKRFAALKKR